MRSASSSPTDPRRAWRWAGVATGIIAGALALVAATWAFAPMPKRAAIDAATGLKSASTEPTVAKAARAAIDLKAFDATLWSKTPVGAPSEEAEAERAKKAPVDLHVDLIGVTDEGGRICAALYDRDRDTILLVHDGDELLGSTRVTKLTRDQVVLKRGTQEVALARTRGEK